METTDISLSVLVPTYNFDCTPLAEALALQADRSAVPVEILIGDDGTTQPGIRQRIDLCGRLPHVRIVRPPQNIGRSAIRNLLFRESHGTHLLFLDSDGVPPDEMFLNRYLTALEMHPLGVVCGGIIHPNQLPSPTVSLRWRYEKKSEARLVLSWKQAHPYDSFRSFNFLIDRASFAGIQFDEAIRHYGFEDVLFGWTLKEQGISVHHIPNPLLNTDIEPNDIYIRKNEEALRTLADHFEKLHMSVRIARAWEKVAACHLCPLLKITFRMLRPCLLRNLTGHRPSVFLLNLYKLGYLNSLLA